MTTRPLAVTSVTFALVAVGCGSSTVDTAKVEAGIKSDLSTTQVKVTSVDCPSDVKREKGTAFNCTVKLSNGGAGKVKVTQQGGTHYTYELVPGSVQIPGSAAEAEIEKQLASQGAANASVNCPDNIIVKLDTTVTCDITGVKGSGSVTYSFSSADGTVDTSSVTTD